MFTLAGAGAAAARERGRACGLNNAKHDFTVLKHDIVQRKNARLSWRL
jgi:hypothetical protein